mgnify:CR=1 FL=1|jgi:hypothetical protein
MNKIFLAWFDVWIFFAITFVGDYNFLEFPMFYMVWGAMIAYRVLTNLTVKSYEIATQMFIFALYTPALYNFFNDYGISYANIQSYHSMFMSALYVNIFPIVYRALNNNKALYPILSIFIALFIASLIQGEGRTNVVFGPNVQYKIIGITFLFSAICIIKNDLKKAYIPILYILSSYLLFKTGSRAALFIIFVNTVVFYQYYLTFLRYSRVMKFMLMVAFFAALYILLPILIENFGRVFYFSMENRSISVRFDMIINSLIFFERDVVSILFGLGAGNEIVGSYPHNLIIEALVHHGLIFTSVLLLLGVHALRVVYKYKYKYTHFKPLVILLIPMAIGSLFSGKFNDNYSVISLLAYVAVYSIFFAKKIPIKVVKNFSNK